jgi:hypothetical protein
MKKVFLVVLIVFIASTVYAGTYVDPLTGPLTNRDKIYPTFGTPLVQFDISGEFNARGYYWDNAAMRKDSTATPTVQNSYMRGYLDLWPKLKVGNTQIITKIQMRDQNPWAPFYKTNGTEVLDVTYDIPTPKANDNISVERAYIHQDFNDKWFTEIGLMSGQYWGTTFGDNMLPRWRVKFQGMTDFGAVGVIYEKMSEVGSTTVEDSEKDDYNAYALYGVTKVGDFTIEPLFYYHVDSAFYRTPNAALTYSAQDNGNDGFNILYISLASKGKVGPLGMEAEVSYLSRDAKGITYTLVTGQPAPAPATLTGTFDNDWLELGAYLNLWNDMDFGRMGAKFAYGSWDEDGGLKNPLTGKFTGAGQDFREDFKSNLILGDEIGFGGGEDLVGMTLIQPYIKSVKLGIDKLTGSASFGYIMSNQKETALEEATAMEIDLGVQYKLTDNFLYKIDAGYADISTEKKYYGNSGPDSIMVLKHEVIVTF